MPLFTSLTTTTGSLNRSNPHTHTKTDNFRVGPSGFAKGVHLFLVMALKSALRKHNSPEIFNTDQGSQYTSKVFTGTLEEKSVRISMDGKGRCMDNIFIERLWRSVKYEKIFLEEFETVAELIAGLKEYFEFYNFERLHQSFSGKTPAEVYWGEAAAQKAA